MFFDQFINRSEEFLKSFEALEWSAMHFEIIAIKKYYDNLSVIEKAKDISVSKSESKNVKDLMEEMLAKYISHICAVMDKKNDPNWFLKQNPGNPNVYITELDIKKNINEIKKMISPNAKNKKDLDKKLEMLEKELTGFLNSILDKLQQDFVSLEDKIGKSNKNFNWIEMHADIVQLEKNYIQLKNHGKSQSDFMLIKDGQLVETYFFEKRLSVAVSFYIHRLSIRSGSDVLKSDLEKYGDNYDVTEKVVKARIEGIKELKGYIGPYGLEFLDKNDAEQISKDLDKLYKNLKNTLLSMQKTDVFKETISKIKTKFFDKAKSFIFGFSEKEMPSKEICAIDNKEEVQEENDGFYLLEISDEKENEKNEQQQNLPNTNSNRVVVPLEIVDSSNKPQQEQQGKSEKASEKEEDSVLGNVNSYKPVISQVEQEKSLNDSGPQFGEKTGQIINTIPDSNYSSLTNTK